MALIDVSELLLDPDFVDTLYLIHRTPAVNALGENTLSEVTVKTLGSVQPASGKTLMRVPEALRVQSIYSFWVKGQIISDGATSYPDVISFQGQRYQVQTILDYMNWPDQNGWCEGICIRQAVAL